ncbi:MAG: alpha/beta fold hydrolase [Chloroflexota bacterium]|mgnify:FL=1|jgi:dipeptidyl aminopeptidase/acylaminoacyl peptidase|nr:alpha/beta hydrolase [Dehalococcoidia bacterium]MED5569357.1 alpha/beta fold hydrolase [Chloroflexota bacterium]MCH2505849.1 lysophospholipase [Dehalococcoidia bacterium]MEE3005379.1 alpha/beta fold hydrolase [Chloroflexota bacterium]MEE3141984.1 alpha/beta fold hydrolase [Chloroflexota bacterium]|tara:strand:- start:1161 stop:2039 length:879 start_codon:yes stop_codon:yes gene_type:complete
MKRAVEFYSEGFKLVGDVYVPDGLPSGEQRAAVLLCHGYTGVKDLYLPDNAKTLNDAGYVVMTFDYKGWGESEGTRSRLAPYSRVADVQAAMTYLSIQPEADADRIGLYGTSYGGATVSWTAAIDQRAKCIVSVVGIGHGARWMSRVRRVDEWVDLRERSKEDREKRATTGESDYVDRSEILLPDRQSAELAAAARRLNPAAVGTIPMEYVDDTIGFNPEWIVDKISPRPILFITSEDDRLVLPEESEQLYAHAGEPKKLVVLKGYGHYEVYSEPAFSEVMGETLEWYGEYL